MNSLLTLLVGLFCFAARAAAHGEQWGPQPAWAPGDVLLPPANVTADCMQSAFSQFTRRYPQCAKAFWQGSEPDSECCSGFAEFYGPASYKASRNCWCSEEVWNWWAAAEAYHYYSVKTALLVCSRLGHVVGFFDSEGGYCNGTAPTADSIEHASMDHHDKIGFRTLRTWLKSLEHNALVRASVATGIMSAFGLSFMLWPIAIELTLAAKESLLGRPGYKH